MSIVVPAATVAIVEPQTGQMRTHTQRFFQALGEQANGVRDGGASGPSLIVDGIGSGRSLIRVTFDLVPAVDGDDLWLIARTGTGNDVAAYSWSRIYNDAAATVAAVTDTSDTQIILAAGVQSDANVGGISGHATIYNAQSTRYKRVTGQTEHYDGARERAGIVAGRIDTALPITGVKLMFSTGAIASGWARVDAP